jgi:hypothetical protein
LRNYFAIGRAVALATFLNPACAGSGVGEVGDNTDTGQGGAGAAGTAATDGGFLAGASGGGQAGAAGIARAGAGGSAGSVAAGAGAGGQAGAAGTGRAGGGSAGKGAGGASAGGQTHAAGRAGSAGTGTGGASAGGVSGAGGRVEEPPATCETPLFTTSDTNGGWSNGGYYVHNNVWNASEAGPETLYACSFDNWYVQTTQPNTTSVKAYPNVHLDINNLKGSPLSSYTTITSTFAATSPQIGIYNVAYDLWLNGVGWGNGTTEIMIWTENHEQRPLGSVVAPQTTFSAQKYDVYRYTSNSDGGVQVITLLSTAPQTSGSIDLKEITSWIVSKGWITSNATVNQIGYGVEVCSTDNRPATFSFTDFSVTMK